MKPARTGITPTSRGSGREVDLPTMTAGALLSILFSVCALALILPGILATAGKLPGNSMIGLRVPEVRKDEEIWVKSHKVVGPYFILAGAALAFGGAFCTVARGWMWIIPAVLAVVALVAVAVGGNVGANAARVFADAKENAAKQPAAAPQPSVDVNALRAAAQNADKNAGSNSAGTEAS